MTNLLTGDLERLSRLMQWVCMGALTVVLVVTTYVAVDVLVRPEAIAGYFGEAGVQADRVTRLHIALALAVNLVTIALTCRALFALWQMFGAFRAGRSLEKRTARLIRSAGSNFLGAALWGIVANTLTILILTINNIEGERQLSINLSSNELFPLLMAGVLFAVGHVLTLASEIDAENKSFV